MDRTSKPMLTRCDETRHHCLDPGQENTFSFSPLSMMLAVGLSYMGLLCYIPSIPTFWKIFIINGCRISSKNFFCIYWDYMVFILQFVNVHYINWLCIASHPYIPGVRPIWSWHLILLMYYWIWLANILLRIFASTFISDIVLLFFFLDIFVWFWYRYWPHRISLA